MPFIWTPWTILPKHLHIFQKHTIKKYTYLNTIINTCSFTNLQMGLAFDPVDKLVGLYICEHVVLAVFQSYKKFWSWFLLTILWTVNRINPKEMLHSYLVWILINLFIKRFSNIMIPVCCLMVHFLSLFQLENQNSL